MTNPSAVLFAAAAAVIFLGAGCRANTPPVPTPLNTPESSAPANTPAVALPFTAPAPTAPPPPDIPSIPAAPPAVADAIAPTPPPNAPRVIRVEARMWDFIPSEIRVKKGERIVLEVTSTDITHGIAIPELGINQKLEPGVTARMEFTAEKTGTFTAPCTVYCGDGHRGMRMTIIAE